MHGQINRITAAPEHTEALQELLLTGVDEMPGCISYVVSEDAADACILWVTEIWDSEHSQKASLDLPTIKGAIEKAMPMIVALTVSLSCVPLVAKAAIHDRPCLRPPCLPAQLVARQLPLHVVV